MGIDTNTAAVGAALLAIVSFIGGLYAENAATNNRVRQLWEDAEKHGYAEKYITEDMRVDFRWITETKNEGESE